MSSSSLTFSAASIALTNNSWQKISDDIGLPGNKVLDAVQARKEGH